MQIDTKLFLLRLRIALNIKNNVDLAKALDVPYSTLNTWLTRNSLPLENIISKPICKNLSIDWLLGKDDNEPINFSKLPSFIAAIDIASETEDGFLILNSLFDGFIIEQIIQKLLDAYVNSKKNMPNNIITRMKRLVFNVTDGRFLMLLDEMLGKIELTKSDNAHDKIQELISGDFLHPLLSKPAFKKSEKMAFQAWAEDLSAEEAEFLVSNAGKIHESLKTLIPKISKRNSSFDVTVMKKLTS
jgi:uncharacterized protein YehS (DUF1456 family)